MLSVLWLDKPAAQCTTIAFLTLALAQLWHAFSMRNPGSGWIRNEVTTNPWIWAALALCIVLLLLAVHWSLLAQVLSVQNPGLTGWALAFCFSVIPYIFGQLVLLRRRVCEKPLRHSQPGLVRDL